MEVECGYRYRFYPIPDQADLLNRTFGCARFVFNKARQWRDDAYKTNKTKIGYAHTSAALPKWKKDPATSWLKEVSSVPLQQALRQLDRAYQNFFAKRAAYPRFRKKDGTQSITFTKAAFIHVDDKVTLAKMDAPLDIRWSRSLPSDPTSLTITREADGKWFISFRVTRETEHLSGGDQIGIDLGLTDFAILSTGEKVANPRHLNQRQKRLARDQRRLARKQKGSRNRAKAKIKVARAHSAVRDARRDFHHQLSTRLVRENQAIHVETLSVKGMLRSKRTSRSISDAGWSEFIRMLEYKCAWYGRHLVKIDRWYPSTKTCSECGTTGHVLSLADRKWTCPDCGVDHDRDVNAAKNILAAGLRCLPVEVHVSPTHFGAEAGTREAGMSGREPAGIPVL